MDGGKITIGQAVTQSQLDAVRVLIRAFVAWHRSAHAEDIDLIDRYFDADAFEAELAGLPGTYAPPAGRLLFASIGSKAAGCVALRDLSDGTCEMKRMFVDPEFHGRGIGRRLGEAVIAEARGAGYRRMRLDTSWRQAAAIALYRRLGFRNVGAYYDLPPDLTGWLLFFERDL